MLTESHLSVDDVDTVLSNGDIDASRITFRVSDVVGGTLQERTSASADLGWDDRGSLEWIPSGLLCVHSCRLTGRSGFL